VRIEPAPQQLLRIAIDADEVVPGERVDEMLQLLRIVNQSVVQIEPDNADVAQVQVVVGVYLAVHVVRIVVAIVVTSGVGSGEMGRSSRDGSRRSYTSLRSEA
jgi:hypothetical protein